MQHNYYIIRAKKFVFYLSQKLKAISEVNGLWIVSLCMLKDFIEVPCLCLSSTIFAASYITEKMLWLKSINHERRGFRDLWVYTFVSKFKVTSTTVYIFAIARADANPWSTLFKARH